ILSVMDVKPVVGSDSQLNRHYSRYGNFSLRYDQETPLRSIDFGGPDQEQKLAEFVTSAIDNGSQGLTVQTAMEELGLASRQDYLPGLEVRLLPHQAIGVAWMVQQEKGPRKGGILADDMGLGKTVQMIATMVKNPPDDDDEYRTILVVVPAALLQQWKDEIEAKTNGVFSVHIHHGKDKLKTPSAVKSKDVVITSYQTLHTDFHTPSDVDPHDEMDWLVKYGGPLARTKFYRAIADEAQFIRNRGTRASVCMAHVRAKYRWMLTGTPVTNTLADLYGLIRFGRFRPYNDWDSFNGHIVCRPSLNLSSIRAQAILKPLLLRRTKNSEIEGVPILQLPPKHIELVKLTFSPEERAIYDSFEQKSKIQINKFIRNNTLLKSHHIVLVMILRLRQLCSHPHLILSQADGFEDPAAILGDECAKELARARRELGPSIVDEVRIKRRFLLRTAADELEDFDEGAALEGTPECPKCGDSHALTSRSFSKVLFADNGRVLSCGHEICFDCCLNLSNSPFDHNGIFGQGTEKQNEAIEKAFETALSKGWRPCPTCGKMGDLGAQKTFKWAAFEPTDQELRDYARLRRESKKKLARKNKDSFRTHSSPANSVESSPARDILELSDSDDDLPGLDSLVRPSKRVKKAHQATSDDDDAMSVPVTPVKSTKATKKGTPGSSSRKAESNASGDVSEAVKKTWSRGNSDMVPSTKMVEMIRLLKEWESTGDKTIIYSQWTSVLDLIEIEFSHHGISSVRFDGKMDKSSRDAVLDLVRPSKRVKKAHQATSDDDDAMSVPVTPVKSTKATKKGTPGSSSRKAESNASGIRAQAILKPLLLRRTKNSEIEGVPILQLPPKHIELVKLTFSPEERAIYDSFEQKSKIQINKFIRNNTLLKSHHIVLVMILRLRQLCSHPHLILSQADGFEDPAAILGDECAKELARARRELGPSIVDEIKRRFLLRTAADELEDFDEGAALEGTPECPKCGDSEAAEEDTKLNFRSLDCCLNLSNSPFDHNGIFGQGTEKQNEAIEKAFETALSKGWRPCPTCGKMGDLGAQKTFKWAAFEPTDQELRDYARLRRESKKKLARKNKDSFRTHSSPANSVESSPARDILELSDSDDDLPGLDSLVRPSKRVKKAHQATSDDDDAMSVPVTPVKSTKATKKGTPGSSSRKAESNASGDVSEAVKKTWSRGNSDMVPSTKMVEMIRLLKEWESTGDKTIIYSQWTSVLDLIEIEFSHHGISSVRFDGKMDKSSRDAVLAQFKRPGRPTVILISTKCGSVGLNLVVANRVINMDLSWNYAAESQAYDSMLRLQDVKLGLSDAALGEGNGVKLSKLSVKDIKYLFGMSKPPTNKDDDDRVNS
ncbi:hypothetical protein AN958_04271, partial [Leucoagaricus sp. SymC.cos]